jgi:hypothetical protein
VKSEVRTITPKEAAQWLKGRNGHNRPLSKTYVSYLANEIQSGKWRLTHQGIAFDSDGVLVDGQHRLSAIVEAGKPVQMLITIGLPIERFPIIDRGVARQMSVITGISSPITEIYGLLLSIANPVKLRLSPDDVRSLHNKIGVHSEALLNYCGTTTRFFSSAPIKTAATICLVAGENKKYILETYRNLVLQNFNELPPIVLSLIRQYTRGLLEFRGVARKEIYMKARYMFTESNKTRQLIRTDNIPRDDYLNEVKQIVLSALQ